MSSTDFIDTQRDLVNLTERLINEDVIALDTEFHGEGRYWPELFLIQLAGSDGPVAVDPLAIDDLSPIGRLLEAERPIKVIHSSRNDIEILMHQLDVEFRSVFDTQLAAAFLGYDQQTALYKLIRSYCGENPIKGHTLSDWSKRPLSSQQIDYALNDVRYLIDIYRKQYKKLRSGNRLEWYLEETQSLTDPSTYDIPLRKLFRRVRSAGKIRKDRLPVLWALVQWRERTAENMNKPRNHVVKDFVLGAITALSPENEKSLASLRGISKGFIQKWGREVLAVIAESKRNPPGNIPAIPRNYSKPGISARRDILRIFLKQESVRLGIAPALLLSKDLLDALAENPPDSEDELGRIPELSGWRGEALGEDLISLMKGKLALRLKPGRKQELQFMKV